jgi:outer membrane protein assembly factor BamE (lipoprotein component of BamABCDE complex)
MKNQNIIVTGLAALVAGCASTGTQVSQASLAQFHPGITTEAQVEAALGPPEGTTIGSDGERTITYVYSSARAKGVDFVPIVGLFAGGATGTATSVIFHFDRGGKLLSYSASGQKTDVHTGL